MKETIVGIDPGMDDAVALPFLRRRRLAAGTWGRLPQPLSPSACGRVLDRSNKIDHLL
jgi:hypothetical protein